MAKPETAPARNFGFSAPMSLKDFFDSVGRIFSCKNRLSTGPIRNDIDVVNALRHDADLGDVTAQYGLRHRYASGIGVIKEKSEAEKWLRRASANDLDETAGNGYVVQSFICYGSKLSEISSLTQLPPKLSKLIDGVSDRGGPFNPGDVLNGKPNKRFIVGATNKDIVVMAVEQGGIAYSVGVWTFLRNGSQWEYGPASGNIFSEKISFDQLLDSVGRSFYCPKKLQTSEIQNDVDAVNAIRHDADLGDIYAQYGLGQRYAIGRGVTKNIYEAERYFNSAAAGSSVLQYELGYKYAYGKDIPQNYSAAHKYFLKVIAQKDKQLNYLAYYQLGLLYEYGHVTPANKGAALALFRLIPKYMNQDLAAHIDKLKASLTAEEVNSSENLYRAMCLIPSDDINLLLSYFLIHGSVPTEKYFEPLRSRQLQCQS